jgi:NADH-quinone oxidoreductase subunit D
MLSNIFKKQRYYFEGDGEMVIDMDPSAAIHLDEARTEVRKQGFTGEEMIVNMGPQHPSTHGVLRLELVLDGEIVKKVTPHIGYLHRNFEKHAENVGWNEVIPYTDRIDYLASMNQNLAYCLAAEKLFGITKLPEKVEYIRVICAEYNRIASHLMAIGTFGLDVGAITPFLWAFRDREKILDLFEWLSGARMLYNYIWIGGLARDLPSGWLKKATEFLDVFEENMKEFNRLLTGNHIFIERTANVGILPPEVAINYASTGPVLRGSGIKWDVRKDEPYSIYDRFNFDIPVGEGRYGTLGSAFDRYWVRIREIEESVKILRQALKQCPEQGDVKEAIPRRFKSAPGAEAYARSEAPRGELGFYVRSNGTDVPDRVKGRSPCFVNISVVDEISRGCMLADLVIIVGSIDIVLGCVDR